MTACSKIYIISMSCVRRESVDTPLNYAILKKRAIIIKFLSLYLQDKCMCIHDSFVAAFLLIDIVTSIVLKLLHKTLNRI